MKVTAIIAEYNPFHRGHEKQLTYVTKTQPSTLKLIVMSGAFVQRSEPAIVDKFKRAQWALLCGADLVLELPSVFALSNSERFAAGAIRLLGKLGVDSLCFGSEQGDASALLAKARALGSDEAQGRIAKAIKNGLSYHQALCLAYGDDSDPLGPNDRLAVQYMKAAMDCGLSMDYLVCHRDSDYHSLDLQSICSASALRERIKQGEGAKTLAYVPDSLSPSLDETLRLGHYVDYDRYRQALHLMARRYTADQWRQIADCVEGLENRLVDCALEESWSSMREALKTKRYSYSRLDRILAYGLLGWTKDFVSAAHEQGPQYARILAFSPRARDFLKGSYDIPLITKWHPFVKAADTMAADNGSTSLGKLTKAMALADTLASQIQAYCMVNEGARQGRQDYVTGPYFHQK